MSTCLHDWRYTCFLSPSLAIFWLSVSSIRFLRLWNVLCHVRQLFTQFALSNFHFILLKYNYNFLKNKHESVHSEINVSLETLKSFFHNENMTGFLYISSNHPCGLEYSHATLLRLAKGPLLLLRSYNLLILVVRSALVRSHFLLSKVR